MDVDNLFLSIPINMQKEQLILNLKEGTKGLLLGGLGGLWTTWFWHNFVVQILRWNLKVDEKVDNSRLSNVNKIEMLFWRIVHSISNFIYNSSVFIYSPT